MIYSQTQKESILFQSQVWLGDLGTTLTNLERAMKPCDDLYCEGYRVRVFMQALQKETDLDEQGEEYIYSCLVKVTGIKDYPVFTPLLSTTPPSVIIGQPGPAGPPGSDGVDGSSANIRVESDDDEILVTLSVDNTDPNLPIDVYKIKHNLYVEPAITLALTPSTTVVENGTVDAVTLNINLLKGRDDVLTSIITSDPALDTVYQGILDLPGLNAGGPSLRSIVEAGVDSTTTYTVSINDGTNSSSASRTRTYVFPFFHGSTPVEPINPYSDLTKLIATQSNKSIAFNATDEYFWFCYTVSYGDLSSIKDQNGFEVLGSFTKIVQSVTSTGLDVNYTESYNLYRTTAATDINGTFTFSF